MIPIQSLHSRYPEISGIINRHCFVCPLTKEVDVNGFFSNEEFRTLVAFLEKLNLDFTLWYAYIKASFKDKGAFGSPWSNTTMVRLFEEGLTKEEVVERFWRRSEAPFGDIK